MLAICNEIYNAHDLSDEEKAGLVAVGAYLRLAYDVEREHPEIFYANSGCTSDRPLS